MQASVSMLMTTIYILLAVALSSLLVTRLTEKPLRFGFNITETSVNVYTTSPINLPSVPSIAVVRGDAKAIGIEIMKIRSDVPEPDPEAGQNNNVTIQLVKGAAPSTLLTTNNQLVIWNRRRRTRVVEVTAVGEINTGPEEDILFDDLTDGDGNGEIIADNEIHIVIQGSGNAAAKAASGYGLYHLVEIDATEALFELLETAV